MPDEVCKVDDSYVRDRMRWVVVLNNGETIYEDDDRPGLEEPSAWRRLKAYCRLNSFYISEFWLQFRSNRVLIQPTDAEGYFFVKSAFGVWGVSSTFHAYVVGHVEDGRVVCQTWKVPELQPLDTHERELNFDSPSVISRIG